MCGICGELRFDREARVESSILDAMTDRMSHRGPDGRGIWHGGSVALGSRRLAIVDLEAGAQPVTDESGTVRVVFNGEIYNHAELRAGLTSRGHALHTLCDTEVLPHLFEELGERFVERLQGMFAIAVWDARNETLTLVRDRLGIKPLYYFATTDRIVFASELSALLAHPAVPREVDPRALHLYLEHEFVPAPMTILAGVRKLRPAEMLQVGRRGAPATSTYWSVDFDKKSSLREDEAAEELAERLQRSVRRRLMSDVPVGAFLSGGIDSSSIVYWMRECGMSRVPTFSLGFEERGYDELRHARRVARALETDHHEEQLASPSGSEIEEICRLLDEPLADPSTVPTYLVSRLARRGVAVCLSGDGADELLAGYDRHLASRLSRDLYERLPAGLRRNLIEPFADRLRPSQWRRGPSELVRRFVAGAAKSPSGRQMRWQTFLPRPWLDRIYAPAMREATDRIPPFAAVAELASRMAAAGALDSELAIELGLYLPDDILAKLDRMSMAVSLEARVPFLDHELVEFCASLPESFKLRNGRGKWLLRRAMRGRLPPEVLRRGKRGFSAPVGSWLRGKLYEPARAALTGQAMRDCPWLDSRGMEQMLETHRARGADLSHEIWALFVFALWHEQLSRPGNRPCPAEPVVTAS